MLEAALEQLLLRFLAPYVDGISKDKLHVGVFRGSLELKGLTIKAEALALLGWEGLQVHQGSIALIKLAVPWSTLYTGKLRAVVRGVHLEIDQLSDVSADEATLAATVREAKRKAIELRVSQLRDLLEQQREQFETNDTAGNQRGYAVRLFRKILNNIYIDLSDVRISFINRQRGLALGLELPTLEVLSTDQAFREAPEGEEVQVSGLSMYKLLRLRGLGVRMSAAGSSDMGGAEYILTPISASLQLAHVPSDQVLRLRLAVATEEIAELAFRRSQVKHLRSVQMSLSEEAERLHGLLVPAQEEIAILANAAASKAEYAALYERHLLHELRLAGTSQKPLSPAEVERLRILEAAFSVRLLARQRWHVQSKVEALRETVMKLGAEKERADKRRSSVASTGGGNAKAESTSGPLLTADDREKLLAAINDESKVETVDLPQRLKFEFVLGKMVVDLIDDRWIEEPAQQLLNLSLQEATWLVDVNLATDEAGRDSLEWRVESCLGTFRALHGGRSLVRMSPTAPLSVPRVVSNWSCASAGARSAAFPEGTSSAASLVIENKVEPEQRLLRLKFHFAPLDVNLFPGTLEQLLDFLRSPLAQQQREQREQAPNAAPAASDLLSPTEMLLGQGERAKAVVDRVYEHIPDKFYLEVIMESPVVHIPVAGKSSATISLAELALVTPHACAYNDLLFDISLCDTTLHAVTACGEQFNMVQPVPISLQIHYHDFDDESSVDVVAKTQELKLALTPEALQILLALPTAAAALMSSTAAPGTTEAEEASAPRPSPVASPNPSKLEVRVSTAVAAAAKALLRFRFNLKVEIDNLDVTLVHMREPVLQLQLDLPAPGLVVYQQTLPPVLLVDIERAVGQVTIMNPLHGQWQPLLERLGFRLQVVRRPEGMEDSATHVIVSGLDPLLVNLTPSALKRAVTVIPSFIASFVAPPPASNGFQADPVQTQQRGNFGTKYRVVNLCDCAFELELQSLHGRCLQMQVAPTGSMWESLDDWILQNFATQLVIRMPSRMGRDGPQVSESSEKLSLEKAGVVVIPGCDALAELILPNDSQRLLVFSGPLRVHNQTDLPMVLRLHEPVQREALLVDVPPTSTCDAAILGQSLPDHKVCCEYEVQAGDAQTKKSGGETPESGAESGIIVISPNGICAVPAFALLQRRAFSAEAGKPRVIISLKPLACNAGYTPAFEVGEGIDRQIVVAGPSHQEDGSASYSSNGHGHPPQKTVNLVCEVVDPDKLERERWPVVTVAVRPPLVVFNAVPIPGLTFGYGQRIEDRASKAHIAIPCFTRANIYSFSGRNDEGLLAFIRLGDENPWTAPVRFKTEDFEAQEPKRTQMQLCNAQGGASVLLEILRPFELRLSCSHWLIDRSGITRPLNIEFHRYGGILPQADGLTLLPAECLEESVDLVLRSKCSVFSTKAFRTPPSWNVFPWRNPCGAFVFCAQTDNIAPCDVFGATCQVTVIRPRLVLTNASSRDIEVLVGDSRIVRLAQGQSQEAHWQVRSGEEETLNTSVRFRPLRTPSLQWSGTVMCGDAAAGSTPFLLRSPSDEAPALLQVDSILGDGEVWTTDVAPERGALAVSFREGSDFVAANRASKTKVSMKIQPQGAPGGLEAVAGEIIVPWGGREIPFGWAAPFQGSQERAVDVFVNGRRIPVQDVRRTMFKPVRRLGIAVAVTRNGSQTLLSVEDHEGPPSSAAAAAGGAASSQAPPSGGAWLQRVEVKFSQVGISLIEELGVSARELFYVDFQLFRFEWRQYQDAVQQVKLAISEVQVDCQLPGRVDASNMDQRRDESLGLLRRERPTVILANCGHGDTAFLTLSAQRAATSTSDLLFPYLEVSLDAIDLSVDDMWLESFLGFMANSGFDAKKEGGCRVQTLLKAAGTPIVEVYDLPAMPAVVQVDALLISQVALTVWCSLSLSSSKFLPPHICAAIRVLSFSGQLTLDGATLRLPARRLPAHRGSLNDFVRGLFSEYAADFIDNAAKALGKSSVLNLPRAPLKLGFMAISYVSDSIGLAVGEAASLLGQLTFDSEYVAQQRQLRVNKRIQGISDGVVEASQSLALGVEGLFDVVRKPVEGARQSGVGGFIAGVGKGVAGSFVKPVSKIGQAISDVGSGIAMQANTDSLAMKRQRARFRRRLPRLLFSSCGTIHPWSELSAQVQQQLGSSTIAGIEEVLQLTQYGPKQTVLLLFPKHLIVAQVDMPSPMPQSPLVTASASSSTASPRPMFSHSPPQEDMQIGGSSSSSGKPKANNPTDLLEAFDETAFKICFQALKPVKTLIYGVQDIERSLTGGNALADNSQATSWVSHQARLLQFCDIANVEQCDGGDILRMEDHRGGAMTLPLFAARLGPQAKDALSRGLASAVQSPAKSTSWSDLHDIIQAEERTRRHDEVYLPRRLADGSGHRTLSVFEVERRVLASGEWVTPYLPGDGQLSWRWTDAAGHPHPQLLRELSRAEAATRKVPPCRPDALFHSAGEWRVVKNSTTDPDGWAYGMAWHSAAWDRKPGLFHSLRRRLWTKQYT